MSTLSLYEQAAIAAETQSSFELGLICRAGAQAAALNGAKHARIGFEKRAAEAWRRWGAGALVRTPAMTASSAENAASEDDTRSLPLIDTRAAQAAAEQAHQARSRFLAAVSHELRTPLQGLKGLVELDDFDALENRRALAGAVEQLCAAVDELTALAAAESPNPTSVTTTLSLSGVLECQTTAKTPSLATSKSPPSVC